MRTNRVAIVGVALATGLALLSLSLLAMLVSKPVANVGTNPIAPQPRPAARGSAPAPAESCIGVPDPPEPRDLLAFPDGSVQPALNGAAKPPPIPRRTGESFAAVVGTEAGRDGRQWYVHGDGARSTTFASPGTHRVVTQYQRAAPVHQVLGP